MAYPVNDYSAASGYRFAVVRGSEHGFGSGSELMWKLPQTSMGQVNSTTQSAPVAAVTNVDGLSWTSHRAVASPPATVRRIPYRRQEQQRRFRPGRRGCLPL